MTRWLLPLVLVFLLLSTGCAVSGMRPAISAISDPVASFGRYQTFALVEPHALPNPLRRFDFPEADTATLRRLAAEALVSRGYRSAPPEQADLWVALAVGQRTRAGDADDHLQTPALRERIAVLETDTQPLTLVVDVVDRARERHIWQGRARLVAAAEEATAAADEVVAVLEELPESLEQPAGFLVPQAPRGGGSIAPQPDTVSPDRSPTNADALERTPPGSGAAAHAPSSLETEEPPQAAPPTIQGSEFDDEF